MQCLKECTNTKELNIWPSAEQFKGLGFNEETFRAIEPFPLCINCKKCSSRPNVLMFGDFGWVGDRIERQEQEFEEFQRKIYSMGKSLKLAVIEVGAGTGVPTVRRLSETFVSQYNANLIRINLRDSDYGGKGEHVSLPMGGKAALVQIDNVLKQL